MKTKKNIFCHKLIPCFLMVLVLFHAIGCRYYKVDSSETSEFVNILNMGEIHKYFIVHYGAEVFELNNIKADASTVSGNLELPDQHIYYVEGDNKRYKGAEKSIVNEVHIYLNKEAGSIEAGYIELPLSDIAEIRIIDKNTGKTIAVYALVTVGAIAIISAIVALTKSSCPYVYAHNGEAYVFEGEIYGGAIGKNLEREDYMPLPSLTAYEGSYRLRISNELKERQYTNFAELVAVKHAADQSVLLDNNGDPQLVGKTVQPFMANSSDGGNIDALLREKDTKVHFFNNHNFSKNDVIMKFQKPKNVLEAKLVLKGKNTLWFDYMFGEFLEKFGGQYDDWVKKEANSSTENRIQRIIDNNFPLSIYMKKHGNWQLIDYLFTVGPLASRDFVVPFDVSDISGDEIEVKLETGFMFWELDYAGMDFSINKKMEKIVLKPYVAIGTGSKDWTEALAEKDYKYMIQEHIGEVTELLFEAPESAQDESISTFLRVQGYYELIRDFKGTPKMVELQKFKSSGYFSDFSRERYLDAINVNSDLASN